MLLKKTAWCIKRTTVSQVVSSFSLPIVTICTDFSLFAFSTIVKGFSQMLNSVVEITILHNFGSYDGQ